MKKIDFSPITSPLRLVARALKNPLTLNDVEDIERSLPSREVIFSQEVKATSPLAFFKSLLWPLKWILLLSCLYFSVAIVLELVPPILVSQFLKVYGEGQRGQAMLLGILAAINIVVIEGAYFFYIREFYTANRIKKLSEIGRAHV